MSETSVNDWSIDLSSKPFTRGRYHCHRAETAANEWRIGCVSAAQSARQRCATLQSALCRLPSESASITSAFRAVRSRLARRRDADSTTTRRAVSRGVQCGFGNDRVRERSRSGAPTLYANACADLQFKMVIPTHRPYGVSRESQVVIAGRATTVRAEVMECESGPG